MFIILSSCSVKLSNSSSQTSNEISDDSLLSGKTTTTTEVLDNGLELTTETQTDTEILKYPEADSVILRNQQGGGSENEGGYRKTTKIAIIRTWRKKGKIVKRKRFRRKIVEFFHRGGKVTVISDSDLVEQWSQDFSGGVAGEKEETNNELKPTLTGVSIDGGKSDIFIGESTSFTATPIFKGEGKDTEGVTITWTSSKPNLATVEDGTVTVVDGITEGGEVVITAKAVYDGEEEEETISVNINKATISGSLKNGAAVYKGESIPAGIMLANPDYVTYTVSPGSLEVPDKNLWNFDPDKASASTSQNTGLGSQSIYLKKVINSGYTIKSQNAYNIIVVDKKWRGGGFSISVPISNWKKDFEKGGDKIWNSLIGDPDKDYIQGPSASASITRKVKKKVVNHKVEKWYDYSGSLDVNIVTFTKRIPIPKVSLPPLISLDFTPSLGFGVSLSATGEGKDITGIDLNGANLEGTATITISGAIGVSVGLGYLCSGDGLLEGVYTANKPIVYKFSDDGTSTSNFEEDNIEFEGKFCAGYQFKAVFGLYCYKKTYILVSSDPTKSLGDDCN